MKYTAVEIVYSFWFLKLIFESISITQLNSLNYSFYWLTY